MSKKLFLLDGMALIYRAYFGFSNNHRINSKGLNTSAIFGFTNTLLEVLRKENPTHIAVVFDTSGPTARHEEFPSYKAHREEMPEDIRISIPYIMSIIEGFKIPVMLVEGFEADDVVGTMAKMAEKEGFLTYMMTPDKDYGQLVSEKILIYKPGRFGNPSEILGVKEVCEKFGVYSPLQVIDVLGLMGDKVDNIPGVKGIGAVSAKNLLAEYGSLKEILDHADSIKPARIGDIILAQKDRAVLSYELALLEDNAPIALDLESMRVGAADTDLRRRYAAM